MKKPLPVIVTDPNNPSREEVASLVKDLIRVMKETMAEAREDFKKRCDDMNANVDHTGSTLENMVNKSIEEMQALVDKNYKSTSKEFYKALSNECYKLEKLIEESQFDPVAIETKWGAVVSEIHKRIDEIKPFVLQPLDVRDALESLDGEERLDVEAIDGLEELIKKLIAKNKPASSGGNGTPNAREVVKYFDLSPYLDGSTKTFNLPAVWRVLSVQSSSAPFAFRETTDYTWTQQAITFTSEVDEATSLAAGQTITILYVTA